MKKVKGLGVNIVSTETAVANFRVSLSMTFGHFLVSDGFGIAS